MVDMPASAPDAGSSLRRASCWVGATTNRQNHKATRQQVCQPLPGRTHSALAVPRFQQAARSMKHAALPLACTTPARAGSRAVWPGLESQIGPKRLCRKRWQLCFMRVLPRLRGRSGTACALPGHAHRPDSGHCPGPCASPAGLQSPPRRGPAQPPARGAAGRWTWF